MRQRPRQKKERCRNPVIEATSLIRKFPGRWLLNESGLARVASSEWFFWKPGARQGNGLSGGRALGSARPLRAASEDLRHHAPNQEVLRASRVFLFIRLLLYLFTSNGAWNFPWGNPSWYMAQSHQSGLTRADQGSTSRFETRARILQGGSLPDNFHWTTRSLHGVLSWMLSASADATTILQSMFTAKFMTSTLKRRTGGSGITPSVWSHYLSGRRLSLLVRQC